MLFLAFTSGSWDVGALRRAHRFRNGLPAVMLCQWMVFSGVILQQARLGSGGDPCNAAEFIQYRQLVWDVVGDGSRPNDRLDALQALAALPTLQPSACIAGAASMHLLYILRASPSERMQELMGVGGQELLQVLIHVRWLDVALSGWPLFGLIHLAQAQLEADESTKEPIGIQWQPLESDDHVRFRNWMYSHLAYAETPPLVDSVHFLARADPRAPDDPIRSCSAAKSMGYLATALVFAEEADASTRNEANDLVNLAESHVKSCAGMQPETFNLLAMLRTEWPLWWLLHRVLLLLQPPSTQLDREGSSTKPAPTTTSPLAAAGEAGRRSDANPGVDSSLQGSAAQLRLLPASVRGAFHNLHAGFYAMEIKRLEEVIGLAPGSLGQLFRNGSPVRRAARTEALCATAPARAESLGDPFWSQVRIWGHDMLHVYDPDFESSAVTYAVSALQPATVGLYLEAGSAGDPYNAEWLQAYMVAFDQLGIKPHVVSDAESVHPGEIYLWRINQMFAGGYLAGAQGVGAAVAEHLGKLSSRGAVLWPRPETMKFYQDKIALLELFTRVGIPTPRSWVVESVDVLLGLLQRGELSQKDFPLMLKHPYASSSRGMVSCNSAEEAPQVIAQWLAEHRVPCLLQQRMRISRDLRLTYVGGEIVHGYWRLKPSVDVLTTGTGIGGSTLDFQIPRNELAPFVREFATRTGIDIGGMDVAFPEGGGEPVVFEVSPIFDLNPEPPAEWKQRPYKEYKATDDYSQRRAASYALCAQQIVEYVLNRRSRLFVDIDNTINDAWQRIRRAALPSWPGETFNAARAFSPAELMRDNALPGAHAELARLARDWEIVFLSARGAPGVFEPTVAWLQKNHFAHQQVILVSHAVDKVAWLADAMAELGRQGRRILLVDDLARGYHTAAVSLDEQTIHALQKHGIPFEVFSAEATPWPQLTERLLALSAAPQPAPARTRVLCDGA